MPKCIWVTSSSRAWRWLQGLAGVALAVGAWSAASALWALDERAGPRSQTVNIRWAPDMSPAERERAEAELGLRGAPDVAGGQSGTTRAYRLTRRSSHDIARILSHPKIQDTHHIDRDALRVELDSPGMSGWRRRFLDADQAPLAGWSLLAGAVVSLWLLRRGFVHIAADLRRGAVWLATRAADRRVKHAFTGWGVAGGGELSSRAETRWAVGLAIVFLLPLLVYGVSDDEEVGLGLFASQIHYRALFGGHWLFWLDALGFGSPMPIGQRLDFHPVFALGSLVSLRVALSAVWITHVAVMVVYFQRLAVVFGVRSPLRTILLAFYLSSAPTLLLFFGTDWISMVIGWSLYPVLVFYVWRLVHGEAERHFWLASLRLALIAGVWMLNSHSGYLAALAPVLAVYVIASAPSARAWACLATAGALAAVMSAERVYFLISEMRMFPPDLLRVMHAGFSLGDYARAALYPLLGLVTDLRGPFVGVLGLATLAAIPFVLKRRDANVRACVAAFAAATLLSLAPYAWMLPLRVFSGIWQFRDPALLFGLLACGVFLQRAFERVPARAALALRLLVVVQIVQQGALLWATSNGYREHLGELQFYRHQGRPAGVARVLTDRAVTFGPRLYVSQDVGHRMRGRLSADGVHVMTDLAFVGLNPINAWFKNVSMDRLYPSQSLMHGLIQGQPEVIENNALLDVLGVNLVMVSRQEGPTPSGLQPLDEYPVAGWGTLLLFGNPHAWPKAVLTGIEARSVELPRRPGCSHDGALCGDYQEFAGNRLQEPVDFSGHDGAYTAGFAASDRERLLFMSTLYRPEFVARAGGRELRVDRVAGAFLGVTIPPGVSRVEIAFRPVARMVLAWVSGISLVAVSAAVAMLAWRRRSAGGTEQAVAA